MNILVVEDDLALLEVLAAYLEESGYRVLKARNAGELHRILGRQTVHLVLLDLELPDEDGLVVARRIHARSTTPFMIVSARNGREDRIAGLELGALDYVTKPFDPRELVLRIRNILNRQDRPGHAGSATRKRDAEETLHLGAWHLHLEQRSLIHEDGHEAGLTRAEFDLLAALALSRGRVKSRDSLIDAVSHGSEPSSDRAIDVLVSRIRRKIEPDPRNPILVLTVPGYGYRLAITP
ncbi:MAG: response regulator transcription factor [Magnetococcales bacterium]|nr:response regulator transcription factor [Magnetococcales bacterium]